MRRTSHTVDRRQTENRKKNQEFPLARRTRLGVIELLDEAPTRVTTCRTTVAETDVQGFLPGALTRRGYLLLFLASRNQELTKTEDLFILTGLV
jgi:hypothetical protein